MKRKSIDRVLVSQRQLKEGFSRVALACGVADSIRAITRLQNMSQSDLVEEMIFAWYEQYRPAWSIETILRHLKGKSRTDRLDADNKKLFKNLTNAFELMAAFHLRVHSAQDFKLSLKVFSVCGRDYNKFVHAIDEYMKDDSICADATCNFAHMIKFGLENFIKELSPTAVQWTPETVEFELEAIRRDRSRSKNG